ncbi:hypothetical protein XENOCAPTIV_015982 [Xenoophorus captivus]|uniref:Uncharacterized protein n=1 Tax=Xenoophorus captivus TaxID=1517983 RepID=A0ABV0S978_9TELE
MFGAPSSSLFVEDQRFSLPASAAALRKAAMLAVSVAVIEGSSSVASRPVSSRDDGEAESEVPSIRKIDAWLSESFDAVRIKGRSLMQGLVTCSHMKLSGSLCYLV